MKANLKGCSLGLWGVMFRGGVTGGRTVFWYLQSSLMSTSLAKSETAWWCGQAGSRNAKHAVWSWFSCSLEQRWLPGGARRAVTVRCSSELSWLLGSSSRDAAGGKKHDCALLPSTPPRRLGLRPRWAGGARGSAAFSWERGGHLSEQGNASALGLFLAGLDRHLFKHR